MRWNGNEEEKEKEKEKRKNTAWQMGPGIIIVI